ncbi:MULTISPECIES: flippase [unclassified Okeania]|uniref:flippase n=1 Tax=unclassified Okeania TaxID=2634635 RepID=UPI0013BC7644|nr:MULTISPECIES: flippase [unclassified Okeania]NES78363.1 flippase [Okeania sp. SIO1H4]NET12317.1 flippase [Okeania sp. SIO1H6]NET21702.1 flippase [Okeania sp. SIO1H5]NET95051.1 flippase [Okeania sp. SIO1H2]
MKALLSRIDFSYIYAFLGEATLALTFIFYIILARVLGPQEYGVFAGAVALAAILSLFIQFGFPTLINREVAANPLEAPKFTIRFLLLEGLNSLPILLVLVPIAQLLGFEGNGLIVCYLAVFSEVCRSAKQTLRAVLRGLGDFRGESISVAIERFFVVLFASGVLFWSENLVLVLATVVVFRTLDILVLLYYLSKKISIWSPINFSNLWETLKMAYPFAISGVLWILYYQIDLVMLKGLTTPEQTGFYSVSYRTIEIFSALPRVIFYVGFTRFTKCFTTNPDNLPIETYKSTKLLLTIVLPTIVVAGFCQTIIVGIIYGEAFYPAINSLAILLPSLSIKMFGTLVETFLQTTRREKSLLKLLLVTVIVNIAANAILIPHLQAVGAAIATLLSEVVLAISGLGLMAYMGYKIGRYLCLIATISLLLAGVPSLILYGLNPGIAIGIMTISIVAIVFLMVPKQFFRYSIDRDW